MTLTRRDFLERVGISTAAAALGTALPAAMQAAIDNTEPMKITQIDAVTFRRDLHIGGGSGGKNDGAEFLWVRLHTDKGLIGTGETYPSTNSQVGALKDQARLILGRDPRDVDGLWRSLYKDQAMRNSGGAEMRILSAVNMAQLDILGQAAGLPLYRLLGGRTRQSVRVYNTTTDYWAIDKTKMGPDTMKIVAVPAGPRHHGHQDLSIPWRGQLPDEPGARKRAEVDPGDPRQRREPDGHRGGLLG